MPRVTRISVDVPAAVSAQSATELAMRVPLLLAIDEIRSGRMTRASGARALGLRLDEFLIEAGKHGLYAIDYDIEDFRRELDDISTRGA